MLHHRRMAEILKLHCSVQCPEEWPVWAGHVESADISRNFANFTFCQQPPVRSAHAAVAANDRFHEQPEPGGLPRRARGGDPVLRTGSRRRGRPVRGTETRPTSGGSRQVDVPGDDLAAVGQSTKFKPPKPTVLKTFQFLTSTALARHFTLLACNPCLRHIPVSVACRSLLQCRVCPCGCANADRQAGGCAGLQNLQVIGADALHPAWP